MRWVLYEMNVEKVIFWNRVYCCVLSVSWFLAGLGCFWARTQVDVVYETSAQMFEASGIEKSQLGLMYGLIGLLSFVLVILNLILVFAPRTKIWWAAHMFNLVMGVLKCCCIPVAVPLIIFWVRPEVQQAFESGSNRSEQV